MLEKEHLKGLVSLQRALEKAHFTSFEGLLVTIRFLELDYNHRLVIGCLFENSRHQITLKNTQE